MLYSFDRFVLDTRAMRLLRDGQPVEMQQRVLEVLLAIVRRPGELVTKQQLIDEVWRGEAVGDASLARCLYEARRALGDDARRPKYLLTVHGRGYRLADGVGVDVAEDAESALPVAPPEPAESWTRAPAPSPRRLRSRLTAALAGAVVLGVAVVWLVAALRRPPAHPPLELLVAVLPVSCADCGEDDIAALGELLSLAVEAQPGVAARPPRLTAQAAALAASLEDTARMLAADVVVTTHIQGGEAVFMVHDARTGLAELVSSAPVPAGSLTGDAELEALVAAAHAGAALIGRVEATLWQEVPDALVPRRAEALRLFLIGRRWLGEGGCDLGAVIDVLEQSTALDPGFSPAWEALSEARLHASAACLIPGDLAARALAAARRARALHPGSLDAALLESAAHLLVGDLRSAWGALGDGRDGRLLVRRARLLALAGVSTEVEPLLTAAVAQDPLLQQEIVAAPELILLHDEAVSYQAVRSSPSSLYLLAHEALLAGDVAAAGTAATVVVERSPVSSWGRLAHALLARVEGDLDGTREVALALARQRSAAGCRDAGMALLLAGLLIEARDAAAALEQVSVAVRGGLGGVERLAAWEGFDDLGAQGGFAVLAERGRDQQRRWERILRPQGVSGIPAGEEARRPAME